MYTTATKPSDQPIDIDASSRVLEIFLDLASVATPFCPPPPPHHSRRGSFGSQAMPPIGLSRLSDSSSHPNRNPGEWRPLDRVDDGFRIRGCRFREDRHQPNALKGPEVPNFWNRVLDLRWEWQTSFLHYLFPGIPKDRLGSTYPSMMELVLNWSLAASNSNPPTKDELDRWASGRSDRWHLLTMDLCHSPLSKKKKTKV